MSNREVWIVLPDGRRERVPTRRRSWKTKAKHWLWEIGLLELPFWEQPEMPMLRGEVLRAVLEKQKA